MTLLNPYEDRSWGPASQARFVLSPAPGVHVTTFRHRILVIRRNRRELQGSGSTDYQESLILQILGGSRKLINDLLAEAHATSFPTTPGVSILTARHELWAPAAWQPNAPLASLILADSMLEETLEDLRDFYRSSTWYAERGIPYRRGYLLHGPPGTGKTTLVLALAGELKLPVATLNLSNRLLTDESLRALVDSLPAAVLLLVEDIDCAFKDWRTTAAASGVTLSGLLNALDGVSSRNGRVLFLTTNHPERLDPALLRPGASIARSSWDSPRQTRRTDCTSGSIRAAALLIPNSPERPISLPLRFHRANSAWPQSKSTSFATGGLARLGRARSRFRRDQSRIANGRALTSDHAHAAQRSAFRTALVWLVSSFSGMCWCHGFPKFGGLRKPASGSSLASPSRAT